MTHYKHTLALLACAVATTAANAASVQITFDNPIFNGSGYDAVSITFANQSPTPGSTTEYVAAGRFQGTATNLVDVTPDIFFDDVNNVFMYCYDIYQNINHGQSVNYQIDLNAATARTLDFIGAVNSVLGKNDPYAWLRNVTAAQGAAIQLGIWESKYDTGWDLNSGDFIATNLDQGTVDYWSQFAAALNNAASVDSKYVMVLKNDTYQDMIAGDPPSNDVPEPGTLALMGVALAGFAASRSRKQPSV